MCALEVLGRYGDGGDGVFRLPATSPSSQRDFLKEVERPSLTIAVSRQISNVTDEQRARLLIPGKATSAMGSGREASGPLWWST